MSDKIDKQETIKKKRGNPRWKKGESGNPKGRPKREHCIPDMLRKILEEPSPQNDKYTNLEMICAKAVEQALKGDRDARNWVADRAEGKAIDRIIQKFDDDELIIL